MKHLALGALLILVLCDIALADKNKPEPVAARNDQVVLEADHALVQAIRKGDKAALGALLDKHFTWTDHTGKTRDKAQVLEQLMPAIDNNTDSDVRVRSYSWLAIIAGTHRITADNADVSFSRIWVKRRAGWRAFVYQATTITPEVPMNSNETGPQNCENPCKHVPFEPQTAVAREVVAAWQAVEQAVVDHDPDTWAKYVADETWGIWKDGHPSFKIGHPTAKEVRIATIKEQKRTGATTPIGKVQSMHIWVFGNTAVMIGQQVLPGSPPYHDTRIFVKRDGHWQLCFAHFTTVEQPSPAGGSSSGTGTTQ